jgi:hypothetical protein
VTSLQGIWAIGMATLAHGACSAHMDRLLAVGGTHIIEAAAPCRLVRSEPDAAVEDLHWHDTLALKARGQARAEALCGSDTITVTFVAPTRLEIEPDVERRPAVATMGPILRVRAHLFDARGRELEVGKFTEIDWTSSDLFEPAIDRAAGEFGFCDTCYGMYAFRAVKAGTGSIEARFGAIRGVLTIPATPRADAGRPAIEGPQT